MLPVTIPLENGEASSVPPLPSQATALARRVEFTGKSFLRSGRDSALTHLVNAVFDPILWLRVSLVGYG